MNYSVKEIIYTLQGEGAQSGRAAVFCRFAGCNLWTGHEADRGEAVCRFCDTDFVGTDGPNGGEFTSADELADAIARQWRPVDTESTHEVSGTSAIVPLSAQRGTSSPLMGKGRSRSEESVDVRPPAPSLPHEEGGGNEGARRGQIPRVPRPLVVCTGGEPLLQMDGPLIDALHAGGFEIAIETNGTLPLPDGIDWVCVSPKAGSTLRVTAGDELKLIYPQPGAEPEQFEQLDFRHFFLQPMDGPDVARNTRLAVEYCLAHPRWRISLQTHKILGIP